jgi:ubiquinone/menaquinone biosynthesis C-methylase UbiE
LGGDPPGPTADRAIDSTEPERDPEGRELDQLRAVVPLDDAQVLEVGCGDGRLTWKYASQARGVLAIDADRSKLAAARAGLSSRGLAAKVQLAQTAAETLPVRREAFDLAIFSWSL